MQLVNEVRVMKPNNTGLFGVGVAALAMSTATLADPMGLMIGRSADISRMTEQSVEFGLVLGDYDDVDLTLFGARFNHKVNPTTVVYVDLAQAELEISGDVDGIAYGLGAFYQMDGVLANTDFGIHGNYHRTSLDGSARGADYKLTSIMLEAHFSGREPLNQDGTAFWNATLGLNRLGGDLRSETELAFGAGITMPNAARTGEIYAGIQHIDGLEFGAGYRHFLK